MSETISCRVCDVQMKAVTHTHLARHDMSIEEYRERYPDAPMKVFSEEHRQKVNESLTGRTLSSEHVENMSESMKGVNLGENSGLWKEDSEQYQTYELRQNRDEYVEKLGSECSDCGISREKSRKKYGKDLNIHHRDGDNRNNEMKNLELLCHSCHARLHGVVE